MGKQDAGASRSAASLIDLATYPIHDLDGADGQALLERCRSRLARSGVLDLPGFLRPDAIARLAEEAARLEDKAHHYATAHNVYFDPPDDALPPDHPRRHMVRTDKGNVPYDLIPSGALLRTLYEWDPVLEFVAAVLGEPRLYRHQDPMAALNINVHGEGQELGWHFDRTDFAITLSLQQCEIGGSFEYVPNLRSADDENYAAVAAILAGGTEGLCRTDAAPGTLTLFRGHHSLHRVTPGTGSRKRLMAALSYVREPNVTFSAYARKLFYGRETVQAECV